MASKNAMKLNVVLVTGFLGILMALKPSTCQAQAEINPDHYEVTNAGGKPAVQNRPSQSRSAGSKHQKPTTPLSRGLLMSRAMHPKHSQNTIQASQSVRASQLAVQ